MESPPRDAMPAKERRQSFERDIFPAELEEIQRRRANAKDPRPVKPDAKPSTTLDLTGLAFSGGGIRSAAFSLGVTQHLIATGRFSQFDYLSTVSGGGYIGSCLSALMSSGQDGERLLVDRTGPMEPTALNYVRNGSNYLLPEGLLSQLRLPALMIAGAFHALLLLLPLVVLAVFLTELFFEVTGHILIDTRHWLAAIGVLPLLLALLRRPLWAGRGSWASRDRSDRRLGGWLLLAVASLLAVPALKWLSDAVNYDATWVFASLAEWLQSQRDLGVRSWLLWTAAGGAVALVAGGIRLRTKLILPLVGALGPLFLLAIYLLACIYAINSPLAKDSDDLLYKAIQTQDKAVISQCVDELLQTKQIRLNDYEIQWNRIPTNAPASPRDVVLVLHRKVILPWWKMLLPTDASPELHIRFDQGWWTRYSEFPNMLVIDELSLLRGHAAWWLYLGGLLLALYNYSMVNVNRISLHPFYRDRLSRTFLITSRGPREAPSLAVADELKLSELGGAGSAAPYHLINTALNLQGHDDPQLRERKTVPFFLAKRHCGSDYTGYLETTRIEAIDPTFNLGTAMAISAAAASPNMGAITVRPLTFLLALLNIRLNYWLPNPAWAWKESWIHRTRFTRLGLGYLLAEALGQTNQRRPFVNCSDGGHIENLAVYELLRRRCRTIVCVDGEADPEFAFFGFITLQRYAEIDLGARLRIDLDPIRPDANGVSRAHHAIGTIQYDNGEEGTLVYLKLSCTGDEPEYLRYYRRQNPEFPHESTGNQFFGETKLEAYRALGEHVAEALARDPRAGFQR